MNDIVYRWPITLLEPFVVLIGRHKDICFRENISNEKGESVRWLGAKRR